MRNEKFANVRKTKTVLTLHGLDYGFVWSMNYYFVKINKKKTLFLPRSKIQFNTILLVYYIPTTIPFNL